MSKVSFTVLKWIAALMIWRLLASIVFCGLDCLVLCWTGVSLFRGHSLSLVSSVLICEVHSWALGFIPQGSQEVWCSGDSVVLFFVALKGLPLAQCICDSFAWYKAEMEGLWADVSWSHPCPDNICLVPNLVGGGWSEDSLQAWGSGDLTVLWFFYT